MTDLAKAGERIDRIDLMLVMEAFDKLDGAASRVLTALPEKMTEACQFGARKDWHACGPPISRNFRRPRRGHEGGRVMQQTPESIATTIFCAGIGALCIAGYLLTETTALDGLLRVAALVIHGDAS